MSAINWSNVSNVQQFLEAPNTATGSYFWVGMLFMIYVVILVSSLSFGFEVAILSSSFVSFLIGLVLAYMGLVAWKYVLMLVGVIILTSLWIMYSKK